MLNGPVIQRKIKKIKSILADIALKQNLLAGHSDYTKFIILCRSRTGSNLLLNLLQSHQNIRLFHELFSNNYTPKKFGDFIGQEIEDVWRIKQDNPLKFLDELVFREMPKFISAVGFKLFYYHAQTDRERIVWDYLKTAKKIRIIHLKRQNILKTYVSQEIALKTNNWVSQGKPQKKKYPAVNLNYDLVLRAFERTRQREQEGEKIFAEHQIINIKYEDLVRDYVQETKRIQDFLNVDYQPLSISTTKQSQINLPEQISNYEELKLKFAHTRWKKFFE